MAGSLDQKLRELIEPIVESYGLSLWGLRYRVGKSNAHLQIFVEGENGVDADVCGDITNALSPVLDSADLIDPAYILEVSSPGLDRILFTVEQMRSSVGQEVTVSLKLAMGNRRKLEGELKSVDDNGTLLIADKSSGEDISVAFENISVARIVPDYSALL